MKSNADSFYSLVYQITSQVPAGRVTTYGRIAALAGSPRASRAVGYALSALKEENLQQIPWQRVINAQGRISGKGDLLRADLQKKLLEKEGIVFDENDVVNLALYLWP